MPTIDPSHVDDMSLNEYLDGALAPTARAALEAHLAICPACAGRLARLRALFARLAAEPDVALERDLTPAVLARIRPAKSPYCLPPCSLGGSGAESPRGLQLIVAVQALAALVVLALTWPALAQWLPAVDPSVLSLPARLAVESVSAWWAAAWQLPAMAAGRLPDLGRTAWELLPASPGFGLSWGLCLAGAGLGWLLSNGILLRASNERGHKED